MNTYYLLERESRFRIAEHLRWVEHDRLVARAEDAQRGQRPAAAIALLARLGRFLTAGHVFGTRTPAASAQAPSHR